MIAATILLASRLVALTFDDIPGVALPATDRCNAEAVMRWNGKLLDTLRKRFAARPRDLATARPLIALLLILAANAPAW